MKNFSQVQAPPVAQKLALVKITNDLLLASDQGCIASHCIVLTDLSAAFDTIDHDILVGRLQTIQVFRAGFKMV